MKSLDLCNLVAGETSQVPTDNRPIYLHPASEWTTQLAALINCLRRLFNSCSLNIDEKSSERTIIIASGDKIFSILANSR